MYLKQYYQNNQYYDILNLLINYYNNYHYILINIYQKYYVNLLLNHYPYFLYQIIFYN